LSSARADARAAWWQGGNEIGLGYVLQDGKSAQVREREHARAANARAQWLRGGGS